MPPFSHPLGGKGDAEGTPALLKIARAFSRWRVQEIRWAILRETNSGSSCWHVACRLAIQSTAERNVGLKPPLCASRTIGVKTNPSLSHTWAVSLKDYFIAS